MKKSLSLILLLCLCLSACTTIYLADTDHDQSITEYYLGAVKVVTPAIYAPAESIRSIEVKNFGFWLSIDSRPYTEEMNGFGAGLGYRHVDRQNIPLDCRLVIIAKTQQELDKIIEKLKLSKEQKEALCVINY
jgi:hypothetical protein